MLNLQNVGSESWWQAVAHKGTPLIEQDPHHKSMVTLTFLWRDREGDETRSPTKAVFIDLNGVTDQQGINLTTLTRMTGTNVWFWQMTIEKNWRGSYRLLPIDQAKLSQRPKDESQNKHKQWWQSLQPWAVTDPLNQFGSGRLLWEKHWSAVHLPRAPRQKGWSSLNLSACNTTVFRWHSSILGNGRNIWLYAPTSSDIPPQERPVVLLLDGEFWARSMPIFSMLANNTRSGYLKDAVYVLIDSIDGQHRSHEQACHQQFWQAIRYELLPQVTARVKNFSRPSKTLVAGQSFAALGALYAGLNWPEVFNGVICQSGAFWWPHIELITSNESKQFQGLLTRQVRSGRFDNSRLKVFQQYGSRENATAQVNDELHRALLDAGIDATRNIYNGGHDKLCWRGGLVEGLRHFLENGRTQTITPSWDLYKTAV